ncbi:MAG: hypothetical protein AB8B55_14030 [Mariniblastus sp.]
METIKKFWSETMQIPEARWIVAVAGLVIVASVGFYLVKLFRDMALGKAPDPSSYITEFQRLRDEGKVDEEEYAKLTQSIPKNMDPDFVALPSKPEVPSKEDE